MARSQVVPPPASLRSWRPRVAQVPRMRRGSTTPRRSDDSPRPTTRADAQGRSARVRVGPRTPAVRRTCISDDYEWDAILPWGSSLQRRRSRHRRWAPCERGRSAPAARRRPRRHVVLRRRTGRNEQGCALSSTTSSAATTRTCSARTTGPELTSTSSPASCQAAHGVSVCRARAGGRQSGNGSTSTTPATAAFTPNTPVELLRPRRRQEVRSCRIPPWLQARAARSTTAPTGYTPWGTYLTCEENFNGYFGARRSESWTLRAHRGAGAPTASPPAASATVAQARRALGPELPNPDYTSTRTTASAGSSRSTLPDPERPSRSSAPRSGRFKHEGIAGLVEGKDGRIVGYMGDDQRFDYIYKFISADNWQAYAPTGGRARSTFGSSSTSPSSTTTGRASGCALTDREPGAEGRIRHQAEHAASTPGMAADVLGATPMDRPEWTTVHPDGRSTAR